MKTLLDFLPGAVSRGRFFPEMAAAASSVSAMSVTPLWPEIDLAVPSRGGVLGLLGVLLVFDDPALASLFRRFLLAFRRFFASKTAFGCALCPSILLSQPVPTLGNSSHRQIVD